MNVLLLHLDGALPNLALMRLAAHHRARGAEVELRKVGNVQAVEPRMGDPAWDVVAASTIFEWSRPVAERVLEVYPDAIIGGTGWDVASALEPLDVGENVDYSGYPSCRSSIGFTQRGCRLKCEFCVVPRKEGGIRPIGTIANIWRGEPHPREILLLDNDFFGNPAWPDRIAELRDGRFRVCFTQGINARTLNDETAAAIASVDYRALNMATRDRADRRIYTAWDQVGHEKPLMKGLAALARHGIKPDHIMVYMLIGFGDTPADREHRRRQLRAFGARPYPMPFRRTEDLLCFQRWVVGAYDKRVPWETWVRARCNPRRLGDRFTLPLFGGDA